MPAAAASAFQLTAARRRLVHHNRLHPSQDDFNSQPREGGWGAVLSVCLCHAKFQLTAARRRLASQSCSGMVGRLFQLTAARRRLAKLSNTPLSLPPISTHSRAKAAGAKVFPNASVRLFQLTAARRRLGRTNRAHFWEICHFNSQLREGGWPNTSCRGGADCHFNSQPREGGWDYF